jgi:hypothetical protein
MEIIVSMVIFSLVLTGITNLFISGKRLILHGYYRLAGGEIGKIFLDPLQMQVRQDTWDLATNDLRESTRYCDDDVSHTPQVQSCPSQPERTLNGRTYTARYDIDAAPSVGGLRRVQVTINWPES